MLLVFDIGNTNTVVGAFAGDRLVLEFRLKSDAERTADEYEVNIVSLIAQRFERQLAQTPKFSASIISSVVPPLTPLFVSAVRNLYGIEPMVVGPGVKSGIAIKVADPASVGADRIVNALAAKELFGAPVLVVDFGTATSFDYVSAEGSYEGGAIAPGLMVALESLVQRTAKLPKIDLQWPKTVVGKNTVQAMQSGTLVGYVCMVDGLIERIFAEVGAIPTVVATGGLGRLVAEYSKRISRYEEHLTLTGLRLIAERNSEYA